MSKPELPQLDYARPKVASRGMNATAWVLGSLIVSANVLLIWLGVREHTFISHTIGIWLYPITNGAMLLFSVAILPFLCQGDRYQGARPYVMVVTILPIAAAVLDFFVVMLILAMG